MTWRFASRRALELLHDEGLAEHGGRPGVRDEGLLQLALGCPHQSQVDGQPDVAALAAACAFDFVENPPFVDGNERMGFVACGLFLRLNGYRLVTSQADATLTVFAVASGDLSEDEFARWLREHIQPLPA